MIWKDSPVPLFVNGCIALIMAETLQYHYYCYTKEVLVTISVRGRKY